MLRFKEALGTKDVFKTSYIVELIQLLCLVKICFLISVFSATYVGGKINH
jgi:hypothetical protein